jgi:DNA-binding IclR family transcriptional regulator
MVMSQVSYEHARERICTEYREMPGMRLTAAQVARLCGIDPETCRAVLADLTHAGVIRQSGEFYSRGHDEVVVAARARRRD